MSKYWVEACPQGNYGWMFPRKEVHIFSYHLSKEIKDWQNMDF